MLRSTILKAVILWGSCAFAHAETSSVQLSAAQIEPEITRFVANHLAQSLIQVQSALSTKSLMAVDVVLLDTPCRVILNRREQGYEGGRIMCSEEISSLAASKAALARNPSGASKDDAEIISSVVDGIIHAKASSDCAKRERPQADEPGGGCVAAMTDQLRRVIYLSLARALSPPEQSINPVGPLAF